ncbi:MAG TPA: hypothetical protein VFC89_05575 [Oscillospiraceae bacterium]|nr:hypothetical protein [Oscillospiraceae bacterium]
MKMRKQVLSFFLIVLLMLSFWAFSPQTVKATDADNLTFQINHSYNHGGSGTLSAVQSGNTVTVTGKVTNAKNQLVINLDSGVHVVWKAELSGAVNGLMNLGDSSNGTFELAQGGYLSSSEPVTIYNPYVSGCSIIINGGVVANTGPDGLAIRSDALNANITVNSGNVSSSGSGIYVMGATTSVTVNNGAVTAKRDAITVRGANSVVNVNGGTVSSTDNLVGSGIYIASAADNVKVNVTGGNVYATGVESNHAICSDGLYSRLELSGGTIKSNGSYGTVYMRASDSNVIVRGTAKVENSGPGDVITGSGMEVSVKGGSVYAANGTAVRAFSVNVSGGTVSAGGAEAALAAMTANISGGGVEAAGSGDAITSQTVDIKGGIVSARSGFAVQIGGAGSVKISNGFVFAFGTSNAIIPNVIKMDFNAQPEISGNAVVCVWSNPGGKPVFTEGTSTNLSANSGSSVVWAQEGGQAGIRYQKGNNKGFFAINGVTIIEAEATSTTSTEAATKVTISTSTEAPSDTTDDTRSSVYSSPASEAGTLPSETEAESQAEDLTITTKESDVSSNQGNSKTTSFVLWLALIILALLLIAAVVIILIMRKKK